jgi:hypothetical protein
VNDKAASDEEKPRLGDLLVASGAISASQLDAALVRQKSQNLPIGQLLV